MYFRIETLADFTWPIFSHIFLWRCGLTRAMASWFLTFLNHTQRRNTFGKTPLDEWLSCCRDLYLQTHNNHNRQTSMTPAGFEPSFSAAAPPQTYTLDRRYCPILWQNFWHFPSLNIHCCVHNSLQFFIIPRQLKSAQNIGLPYI
jgi:hypothetical protein